MLLMPSVDCQRALIDDQFTPVFCRCVIESFGQVIRRKIVTDNFINAFVVNSLV